VLVVTFSHQSRTSSIISTCFITTYETELHQVKPCLRGFQQCFQNANNSPISISQRKARQSTKAPASIPALLPACLPQDCQWANGRIYGSGHFCDEKAQAGTKSTNSKSSLAAETCLQRIVFSPTANARDPTTRSNNGCLWRGKVHTSKGSGRPVNDFTLRNYHGTFLPCNEEGHRTVFRVEAGFQFEFMASPSPCPGRTALVKVEQNVSTWLLALGVN
jgi:hypothetical protein